MLNFLAAHNALLLTVIAGAMAVWVAYVRNAYDAADKKVLTVSVLEWSVVVLILGGVTYFVWMRHLPAAIAVITGGITLACASLLGRETRKLLSADVDAAVSGEMRLPVALRPNTGVTQSQRVGSHELFLLPDGLWASEHYTLLDGWWFILILTGLFLLSLWNVPVALIALPVCRTFGQWLGGRARLTRPRLLLEVRGRRIIVDGRDQGSIPDARIAVRRSYQAQHIEMTVAPSSSPIQLVKTHDKTLQQAEEIKGAIRMYLRERQQEQVWPPPPDSEAVQPRGKTE